MAEADHPEDVIRMTKALSSFFRISLSKGKEWITCAEELLHVRRYLDIQKMRHTDLLDFTMSEEEATTASTNDRDQRAAGVDFDLTRNRTTAAPLHPMVRRV